MAFNGSGTFVRLFNWVTDRNAGIKILASRMDQEQDGIATGLTNCLTRDGQSTPSQNLPMATKKHTGVGAGTAKTDYADVASVQNSTYKFAADAEASDTYAITLAPAITAYVTGQSFNFSANTLNTGAATLNVSTLGDKTIKKNGGANDLETGDIVAGQVVSVVYDGTNFQMQSQIADESNVFDIPFSAGYGADGSVSDLVVQDYSHVIVGRAVTIEGEVGRLDTVGTDADVIVDVLKNGSTIYSTKPEFAASSNSLTAGVLSTTSLVSGDRLTFIVTQIGSTIAGGEMTFTLQGRLT